MLFNRNNKRPQARAFEHAASLPESAFETQPGSLACLHCRGFYVPLTIQANGINRVVGVQCLNCEIAVPVDSLGNLPSPMAGGAA